MRNTYLWKSWCNSYKLLNIKYNYFIQERKIREFSTGSGSKENFFSFGFQKVSEELKNQLVKNLFSNISNKYDLMNDLMSFRLHRCWKKQFVKELDAFLKYYSYTTSVWIKQNNYEIKKEIEKEKGKEERSNIQNMNQNKDKFGICKILDLAGGTGDIAFEIMERSKYYFKKNNEDIQPNAYEPFLPEIIVCDANKDMIDIGKKKARELKHNNIIWLEENSEDLKSFEDNSIDIVTISFGIRNFTDIKKSLDEIFRILKPGGRFLCLEFCKAMTCPQIDHFYKIYLNHVIPIIGQIVTNNKDAYKYLAESIQVFFTPNELSQLIYDCNFRKVTYTTMSGGIVAIHSAYKMLESGKEI